MSCLMNSSETMVSQTTCETRVTLQHQHIAKGKKASQEECKTPWIFTRPCMFASHFCTGASSRIRAIELLSRLRILPGRKYSFFFSNDDSPQRPTTNIYIYISSVILLYANRHGRVVNIRFRYSPHEPATPSASSAEVSSVCLMVNLKARIRVPSLRDGREGRETIRWCFLRLVVRPACYYRAVDWCVSHDNRVSCAIPAVPPSPPPPRAGVSWPLCCVLSPCSKHRRQAWHERLSTCHVALHPQWLLVKRGVRRSSFLFSCITLAVRLS